MKSKIKERPNICRPLTHVQTYAIDKNDQTLSGVRLLSAALHAHYRHVLQHTVCLYVITTDIAHLGFMFYLLQSGLTKLQSYVPK